jgi:putative addiction module component (TIGR02574 family)
VEDGNPYRGKLYWHSMSGAARKLLKAALRLPARERAAVAQSLIRSLDEGVDPDAEAAWAKEITRRVKDIDEGKTKLIPWSEVRRKLYKKIKSASHGRR